MFFFGHIGITAGVIQGVNQSTGRKIDLRKAMFLSVLPDLLDKPVGVLYPNVFGNHTRLWGHSLLVAGLVLGLLLALGRRLRYPWILWGTYLGHFLLDRLWINDYAAMFWPFATERIPLATTILKKWHDSIYQPWSIFGELTGLLILIYLYGSYRLDRPGRWRQFWRTGNLTALH